MLFSNFVCLSFSSERNDVLLASLEPSVHHRICRRKWSVLYFTCCFSNPNPNIWWKPFIYKWLYIVSNAAISEGYRTVDFYEKDKRLLEEAQALADLKFTYVVSCQLYGAHKKSKDKKERSSYNNILNLMLTWVNATILLNCVKVLVYCKLTMELMMANGTFRADIQPFVLLT